MSYYNSPNNLICTATAGANTRKRALQPGSNSPIKITDSRVMYISQEQLLPICLCHSWGLACLPVPTTQVTVSGHGLWA